MQKKLIAIAIAAALAPAAAMADSSNVTVYGIADVSFDRTDNDAANSYTNSKVSSNSSRLGLKGSEDLGNGLKAVWQIEQAIAIDGTTVAGNQLGNRNTFVGLAGDSWGQLTMGRNDSPYKSATRAYDVFMDHIADNRSLMGGAGGNASNGFDQRFTDTVRYDSPNFSGFTVSAAWVAGAETNTVDTQPVGKAVSLAANYANGPFTAAAAYQKNNFGMGGAINAMSGNRSEESAWKVGGSYKAAQFGVNAVYEKTKDDKGSAVGGLGHKAYYLSGTFNATANDAIKLAYTKADDLQAGDKANSGAKQWSLGVDHSLSKRTTAYAMYTKLDNDSAAQYALSTGTIATGTTAAGAAGASPTAWSFGMKHVF